MVKSPIVGTFYSAPSPEADPSSQWRESGRRQRPRIIEAMKLMNEIESDVAGEVVQIFVENGSLLNMASRFWHPPGRRSSRS